MKIQVIENPAAKQPWHFRIIARNNKTVAVSENYVEKRRCMRTAQRIMTSAAWKIEFPEPYQK